MTEDLGVLHRMHMDPGPSGRRVNLTTHFHLVSMLRVRGTVPPLPLYAERTTLHFHFTFGLAVVPNIRSTDPLPVPTESVGSFLYWRH
jgi:hypothetical protein